MSSATTTMGRSSPVSLPVIQDQPTDGNGSPGPGPGLPAAAPEPSAARLILTLGVAGFLSGLCLVLVYIATEPAIERNRIAAIEAAVFQVLPGAESFEVFEARNEEVIRHDAASGAMPSGPSVYAGFDADGRAVGFAIPGAGPGFQDTLEILIGWNAATRRVVGMAVLETRETPGLGDKIITDERFTSSLENLALEPPAILVEPGQRQADNEVDGISGATISAQAIVNIINDSVGAWDGRLPDQASLRASTSEQAEKQSETTSSSQDGNERRPAR